MSVNKTIYSIIPSQEELLKLDLEDVAAVIMESLNSIERLQLNRNDFAMRRTVQEYPLAYQERLLKALIAGWGYLEREGLIAEMPARAGWYFITDKGKIIRSREDLNAYRASRMLPQYLLHPVIGKKVEVAFQNAEYDTAVFQAQRVGKASNDPVSQSGGRANQTSRQDQSHSQFLRSELGDLLVRRV